MANPKDNKTQQKLKKARDKAQKDLLWFAKRCCGFPDLEERPHRMFTDFMTQPDPLQSDKKRSIFLAPRAHGKTSIATVAYPLWKLVRNPHEQILIGSFTQELARKFLMRIKSVIEAPDDAYAVDGVPTRKMFRMLFGDWTASKTDKTGWSLDSIQIPDWRTGIVVPFGTQHSIAVAGAKQQLASIHPTIAIFDDLVDEQTAKSKAARETAWDFIRLVEPLVNPGAGHEIWLVGTRYAAEDTYGYIMDQFGDRYNVFIAEINGPVEIRPANHSVQVPNIGEEYRDENFLWPKNPQTGKGFDVKTDQELRRTMNSDKEADYWAQYHNRPWAAEKAKFKPEYRRFYYLREIWDGKEWKIPLHLTMTADPNAEGQFKRDNAAISVTGVDWQGNIHIVEALRGAWDWPTFEIELIRIYKKWPKISVVAIEAQRIKNFVSRTFQETCRRLNTGYIPIYPFERKTTQSKNDRIETILAPYNRMEILFLADETPNGPVPAHKELIKEMERWNPDSKVNQDDLLDTLADHLHPMLFRRPPKPANLEPSFEERVKTFQIENSPSARLWRETKKWASDRPRIRDMWGYPEAFV